MTDIPIIFSAPMVRALLDGRKTMTRRLAWRQVEWGGKGNGREIATPWRKVKPGDRLWVRESWKPHSVFSGMKPRDVPPSNIFYAADNRYAPSNTPWVPSIFMPRWASRLTLTVTATKVERLQAISEADAEAEGIESFIDTGKRFWKRYRDGGWNTYVDCPIGSFASLWTEIHGDGSWESNPELVALTFTVTKRNIDAREAA